MFASRTNWNLASNPLSVALAQRHATGQPVIDLTASNPTQCGFTNDAEAILAALSNRASLKYEPDPRGLLTARQAVCDYYANRGDHVSPDRVLLTTGTSEAYSYVFRLLCNPGDEILVPQPSYPLFDFLADLQDVRLVRYPLLYDHGWQIDFHALQQAITPRTRGVIVVHPNNPTGHFCKPQEMAQLNEICSASNIAIIADEVFLDFSLGDAPRKSFVANAEVLTFIMSGLSKISGLPQMKAAWLVTNGPDPLRSEAQGRLEVIADTYLSMGAPVQHALPVLLQQRQAFQLQLRSRVQANLAELDRRLNDEGGPGKPAADGQGICTRLHVEGGWYAIIMLPQHRSSDELAMQLLTAHGIYVHPGHYYDFASPRAVVVSLLPLPSDLASAVQELLGCAANGPIATQRTQG